MLQIVISVKHISVLKLYIKNCVCVICIADWKICISRTVSVICIADWKNKDKTDFFFLVLGVGHNLSSGARRISLCFVVRCLCLRTWHGTSSDAHYAVCSALGQQKRWHKKKKVQLSH